METIITFVIASICGYGGYLFGKKEHKENMPELTSEQKQYMERIQKGKQAVFNYNENIAIRGAKHDS